VHPVLVHVTSIGRLVVRNQSQSLLQHVTVQQGVQLVARSVECTNARTEFPTVLFFSQVFIELGTCEFLVSLASLILALHELVFERAYVRGLTHL